MIFRITAKLGKKIGVTPSKALPPDSNPFADWSARLFTANRIQYILITNTSSLYSMVMRGKGAADESRFLEKVRGCMHEFLHAAGHGFIFEKFVAPSMSQVSFSKALHRGVTGSMNDMVFQAEVDLTHSNLSLFDLSLRLNQTPFSCLRHSYPWHAFEALRME